jgi:hypothetical protein
VEKEDGDCSQPINLLVTVSALFGAKDRDAMDGQIIL